MTPEVIFPRLTEVIDRLRQLGWSLEAVAHKRTDTRFARDYGSGRIDRLIELFRRHDVLFGGIEEYARLPIVLGARGHAQMIPFGLGNIPLAIRVNPKVQYFADEIGHPDWAVDPMDASFVDNTVSLVEDSWSNREQFRAELVDRQDAMMQLTLGNLSAVYESMAGSRPEPGLAPYRARERRLASACYEESYERRQEVERRAASEEKYRADIARARRGRRRRQREIENLRATVRSQRRQIERRDATIRGLRADNRSLERGNVRRDQVIVQLRETPDSVRLARLADASRRRGDYRNARRMWRAARSLPSRERLGVTPPGHERFPFVFVPVSVVRAVRWVRGKLTRTVQGPGLRSGVPADE